MARIKLTNILLWFTGQQCKTPICSTVCFFFPAMFNYSQGCHKGSRQSEDDAWKALINKTLDKNVCEVKLLPPHERLEPLPDSRQIGSTEESLIAVCNDCFHFPKWKVLQAHKLTADRLQWHNKWWLEYNMFLCRPNDFVFIIFSLCSCKHSKM